MYSGKCVNVRVNRDGLRFKIVLDLLSLTYIRVVFIALAERNPYLLV